MTMRVSGAETASLEEMQHTLEMSVQCLAFWEAMLRQLQSGDHSNVENIRNFLVGRLMGMGPMELQAEVVMRCSFLSDACRSYTDMIEQTGKAGEN